METIIILCLLIIIILIFQDKPFISSRTDQKEKEEKQVKFPEIMGHTKSVDRNLLPDTASDNQVEESEKSVDNLDIQPDENEYVKAESHQEESDKDFRNMPDLEAEEEEMKEEAEFRNYSGLAQGVTFEELGTAGMLLKRDKLEPSQQRIAADIVQKIHGTELFDLLVNSVEDASRKIEILLSLIMLTETETDSSILLQKTSYKDFNIENFI